MTRHLRRFLSWARINDEQHEFSITHAFVVITCLVYWRHPDATTAATAAAAVANYAVKRELLRRAARVQAQVENDPSPRLDALEKQVADVTAEFKSIRSGQAWSGVLKR